MEVEQIKYQGMDRERLIDIIEQQISGAKK